MKKIRNIIIYIIVSIVILVSFKMPEIVFEIKDSTIGMEVYEKAKAKNTIDVEAEKIYLVKAIHDIESESIEVAIESNKEKMISGTNSVLVKSEDRNIDDFEKELLKLKEYNILENLEIDENKDITVGMIDKFYQKSDYQYTVNNLFFQIGDSKYKLEIENKTGKILYIAFEKDNLCHTISKKEIMRNYIKYLDLYIIDDWVYENNVMKSQKADLSVTLVESVNDEICMLSVHSNSKILNNLIEYQNIED